jgi:hypothetical protein
MTAKATSQRNLKPLHPCQNIWTRIYHENLTSARARGIFGLKKRRHTDGLPMNISEMTNDTKNRTNKTWAIQAEVPAIPVKPNIPAIMATTKKINA